MPRVHIKKNDQVYVLSGKDRGKSAKVLKVFPDKNRAIVEGLNNIQKHTRPNPKKNPQGGVIEREASVDASNVMVVCPNCDKPSRLGHRRDDEGRGVRTCRRCGGDVA